MALPINGELDEYRQELREEVGDDDLVEEYIESFMKACDHDLQNAMEMVLSFTKTYWGPLFHAWLDWVFKTTGVAPIDLLLRDCWPAGKIIQRGLAGNGRRVVPLYLSRAMLGIEDEAKEKTESEDANLLHEYMQPVFEPGVILVDSGCWGSILVELFKRYHLQSQARFFFSHNPHVPGWLNWIGLPESLGEVFNDSIEVLLAKRHKRVKRLRKSPDPERSERLVRLNGHSIEPVLKPAGFISYQLHEAAKMGITLSRPVAPEQTLGLVRRMVELHLESRDTGRWTGMMPRNTPTWEKGERFLAEYPEELKGINPVDLLDGGYPADRRLVDLSGLPL